MSVDSQLLQRIQAVASIASSIAIPVVLAVIGYFVQKQLADEGLKKDYVAIAAGILSNSNQGQEPDLRKWAVTVLDANSPIPFSSKARQSLESGSSLSVVVTPPALPPPPPMCMKPPRDRKIYAAYTAMAAKADSLKDQKEMTQLLLDFAELVRVEEEGASAALISLQCLQSWAKMLVEGDEDYRKRMGLESSKSVYERLAREAAVSAASSGARK